MVLPAPGLPAPIFKPKRTKRWAKRVPPRHQTRRVAEMNGQGTPDRVAGDFEASLASTVTSKGPAFVGEQKGNKPTDTH